MSLVVYNTLTRDKEPFETIEPGKVRMYVCGPTVYDKAHVGHAMSAIVFDVVRRYLEYSGYQVTHVMNFTDVDDKIISARRRPAMIRPSSPIAISSSTRGNWTELQRPAADSHSAGVTDHPGDHPDDSGLIEEEHAYVRSQRRRLFPGAVRDRLWQASHDASSMRRVRHPRRRGARRKRTKATSPCGRQPSPASQLGEPLGQGPARLAHRVLSHDPPATWASRSTSTAAGNDLIFPHHENEIAQTESYHRQTLCPLLDAQRHAPTQRREDVQEPGQPGHDRRFSGPARPRRLASDHRRQSAIASRWPSMTT